MSRSDDNGVRCAATPGSMERVAKVFRLTTAVAAPAAFLMQPGPLSWAAWPWTIALAPVGLLFHANQDDVAIVLAEDAPEMKLD